MSVSLDDQAVGLMIATMLIVWHDILADYHAINPHTARIYTQDFDVALLDKLRGLPEIESVDASYNIWLKIASKDSKLHPINLNSIPSLMALPTRIRSWAPCMMCWQTHINSMSSRVVL